MEAATRWPANVVAGADFVSGRYEIGPDEQIIDLQVSLDDLPVQSGWQLAIHQDTVLNMMRCLRWPLPADYAALEDRLATALADAELLREALTEARHATAEAESALLAVTKVQRPKGAVHASAAS